MSWISRKSLPTTREEIIQERAKAERRWARSRRKLRSIDNLLRLVEDYKEQDETLRGLTRDQGSSSIH